MSLTGFISYKRVGWTGQTPWNPTNLNIMDKGIKDNNDMIANLRSEVSALNSNIICTNISMESSSDDAEFYFSNGIEGLYLVVAIDLDDKSNIDNRGFIAIMDVRKNISYRHILQSNTIEMPGHSNIIVLLRGATNYLCSSIRLVRY